MSCVCVCMKEKKRERSFSLFYNINHFRINWLKEINKKYMNKLQDMISHIMLHN